MNQNILQQFEELKKSITEATADLEHMVLLRKIAFAADKLSVSLHEFPDNPAACSERLERLDELIKLYEQAACSHSIRLGDIGVKVFCDNCGLHIDKWGKTKNRNLGFHVLDEWAVNLKPFTMEQLAVQDCGKGHDWIPLLGGYKTCSRCHMKAHE